MRLTSIKMSGFKSFVDPTVLSFPASMVGIVGPNGCGKSNIIDAVRWVMGEGSRHIRGDTMEDIIFSGSSMRKPVGQASVELVFDNSDGRLGGEYSAYTDISIRRQVVRDGQSKYFLNGVKCRRKDIVSLFLGTGLGPHSYAIIEQGMVSRLIDAKPDELRVYLEEAAGISRYKERRRETENRIHHTRENLDRLNDVIEEITKRIEHLRRQAKVAERYKTLKAEERQTKAELLALQWQMHHLEMQQHKQSMERKQTEIEKVMAERRAIEAEIEKLQQQHTVDVKRFNDIQGNSYQLEGEISRVEQSIQHTKELGSRYDKELQQVRLAQAQEEQALNSEQAKASELETKIVELEPKLVTACEQLNADTLKLGDAEARVASWQDAWEILMAKIAKPTQTIKVETSRIEYLEERLDQLKDRKDKLSEDVHQHSNQESSAQSENLLASRENETGALLKTISLKMASLTEKIGIDRNTSQELGLQLEQAREKLQHVQAQLTSLRTLQATVLGQEGQAVNKWLEQKGLSKVPRLMDEIETEPGWETAVETVLGDYLEAICIEDITRLASSIDEIKTGRLTVLNQASPGQHVGTHGTLASKVKAPVDVTALLGNVLIARDIESACKGRDNLEPGQSIITKDGIWMAGSWLRVSRTAADKGSVLQRKHEISALEQSAVTQQEQVENIDAELKACQRELYENENERDRVQVSFTDVQKQHAKARAEMAGWENEKGYVLRRRKQLQNDLEETNHQVEQVQKELEESIAAKGQAEVVLEKFNGERKALLEQRDNNVLYLDGARNEEGKQRESAHQLELDLESCRSSLHATQASLQRMQEQAQQLQQRSESLQASIRDESAPLGELNRRLKDLVGQRVEIGHTLTNARNAADQTEELIRTRQESQVVTQRKIEGLRNQLNELQLDWQEVNVRCTTIKEKLAEHDLSPESLLQQLPGNTTPEKWEDRVQSLERKISRLEPINLAAIGEHKEYGERKEYLDRQHKDLVDALETLENAIRKIDKETKDRFKEIFERVNSRLQDIYPRLFRGGNAFLEMTGNDLLTTGVSIMARLPGKRLSSIQLLSGGEKALTAVALIFSLFELNPAPFCLLDEVDAPLDDANIARYCELLRDMSDRVQFIYITHNKYTMEHASRLLGITMNEPGVSRIVSVDVDEATELAAAS